MPWKFLFRQEVHIALNRIHETVANRRRIAPGAGSIVGSGSGGGGRDDDGSGDRGEPPVVSPLPTGGSLVSVGPLQFVQLPPAEQASAGSFPNFPVPNTPAPATSIPNTPAAASSDRPGRPVMIEPRVRTTWGMQELARRSRSPQGR
jgi:hypothetical protein